jgi:acyl-CoA thioester hydrolase
MRSGVAEVTDDRLRFYQELVRLEDGVVSATFLVDVEYAKENGWRPEPLSGELRARASNQLVTLPDYARPRGMALDPPRPAPTPEEADDLGLMETFRGVVPRQDTDIMCRMTVPSFMGCFAVALPHFVLDLGDLQWAPGTRVGVVVLEARLVYRTSPILGDALVVRTGLKAQRTATTHFCHWMFHVETGECLCSTEFVAAMLDLDTRKLLEPSQEARARIGANALASLTP